MKDRNGNELKQGDIVRFRVGNHITTGQYRGINTFSTESKIRIGFSYRGYPFTIDVPAKNVVLLRPRG